MIPQRLDLTMNFHLFIFLPFRLHKSHCLTLLHVLPDSSTVCIIIYLKKQKLPLYFIRSIPISSNCLFHLGLVWKSVIGRITGVAVLSRSLFRIWASFLTNFIFHTWVSATIYYIRLRHHVGNDDQLEFYGPDHHFEWKSVIGGLN